MPTGSNLRLEPMASTGVPTAILVVCGKIPWYLQIWYLSTDIPSLRPYETTFQYSQSEKAHRVGSGGLFFDTPTGNVQFAAGQHWPEFHQTLHSAEPDWIAAAE